MTEEFSATERAALMPYVSNLEESVFALRHLPEEVVAVLFARYSRSRDSLRRNLLALLQEGDLALLEADGVSQDAGIETDALAAAREKARQFHEKYVIGYGHGSVAEHGCVHLALEDVSIIASKLIEDARLASFTEKSTRYVAFDPSKVYFPPLLNTVPALAAEYKATIQALLSAYTGWTEDFVAKIKARTPRTEKQTERGYDNASRATAFDLLRYLLPTATHTNIGLTLNARTLENLITKLLSQPLAEGQELGQRMKAEAQHIVPTLLKYADRSAYRAETETGIDALAGELIGQIASVPSPAPVTLITADPDAGDRLVAAILYGHVGLPMPELAARVKAMTMTDKERVIDAYLAGRGKHDAPGRALERIACTLEMTMDYGAYRDIQRHRMATQTTQPLTPALGFATPPDIGRFGYGAEYEMLMARAAAAFTQIAAAGFPREAAYVLPLATQIRALFTWNLREVTHFVELRSARQGHPAYRKIAQEVYHAVAAAHPLIARYMRPDLKSYALTRD